MTGRGQELRVRDKILKRKDFGLMMRISVLIACITKNKTHVFKISRSFRSYLLRSSYCHCSVIYFDVYRLFAGTKERIRLYDLLNSDRSRALKKDD